MVDLTAIILTKNEEKNIYECIASIKNLAKRIIVVDSGSTDHTVDIARAEGAQIYEHEFINYSKQFSYALKQNIETKWVLRIDADERITEKAAEEIERLCIENENTNVNGLIIRLEVVFMGKRLRHGGIYPIRVLRIFKYGIGNIEEREMDEHIVLTEGKTLEIKQDCIHHDFKNLTYWINKHNLYSEREAADYFRQKETYTKIPNLNKSARIKRFIKFNLYYKLPIGVRAHLYYCYRYYIKLGFLDGREGKIFAFLQAYWYRFLVDAKIYEKQIQNN